jgi:hypothetical protein
MLDDRADAERALVETPGQIGEYLADLVVICRIEPPLGSPLQRGEIRAEQRVRHIDRTERACPRLPVTYGDTVIDRGLAFTRVVPALDCQRAELRLQGSRYAVLRLQLGATQVHTVSVQIDEPGSDDQPADVDHPPAAQRLRRERSDTAGGDSDVADAVEPGFRIHHPATRQHQVERARRGLRSDLERCDQRAGEQDERYGSHELITMHRPKARVEIFGGAGRKTQLHPQRLTVPRPTRSEVRGCTRRGHFKKRDRTRTLVALGGSGRPSRCARPTR